MRLKELRQALYTRVNSQVGASVVGVYSKVPQADDSGSSASFPYITIGAITLSPQGTDGTKGISALADVSLWHRSTSLNAPSDIASAIYTALHRYDLPITGVHTIDCLFENATELQDPDGLTMQDVLTFRITYDDV